MPDTELLAVQLVQLSISLEKLLSKPGHRVSCGACGEEIINEREVVLMGTMLCRACAGRSYHRLAGKDGAHFCLDEMWQPHQTLVEKTVQAQQTEAQVPVVDLAVEAKPDAGNLRAAADPLIGEEFL
jgi:hypothetical protein